jgi:hypothetical protein
MRTEARRAASKRPLEADQGTDDKRSRYASNDNEIVVSYQILPQFGR